MAYPNSSRRELNTVSFVEELGVHFGNGSLFDDRRWGKPGFDIYGNLYDDQPYLEFHVSKLIEDAYGITLARSQNESTGQTDEEFRSKVGRFKGVAGASD